MLTNEEYSKLSNQGKECCPVCYQERIVEHTDNFPKYLECTSCGYKWENVFSYNGINKYKVSGFALYKK